MLAVLRNRNFALLWSGQFISIMGDWLLVLALPFYIFDLTHSILATGGMFIAVSVPRLLLGSLAGVFADRWNRRTIMIVTDLLRAGILLLLLLVHSVAWLWLIYAVALLESAVSQFFLPAKSALLPQIVKPAQLLAANSLDSLSEAITRLIGPTIGGALYAFFGINSIIALDSTSYLLSALLIFLLVMQPLVTPATNEEEPVEAAVQSTAALAAWGKIWQELVDGLRIVLHNRLVLTIFIGIGVMMIGEGIIEVLLVGFAKVVLHGDASTLGWILSAQGIGTLLGSLINKPLSMRVPPRILIPLTFSLSGILFIGLVNTPNFIFALGLMALIGLCFVLAMVTAQTLIQQSIDGSYLGRVFGSYNTTLSLLVLIGMGIASALTGLLGIVPLLDIAGATFILTALIFLRMPNVTITQEVPAVPEPTLV
ncbi:MFS transporter [Dictyobacter alpinus]|uniref:MFS transporter n=1 Tax=Dictyobacter alpinus TaxID=2014873 RepID=A0A402BCB5_9CHLR|nr:MFS transporter [Dictyobacter alpinus]GCE28966.1 MFS transporter [Dictyobacter alpinus]